MENSNQKDIIKDLPQKEPWYFSIWFVILVSVLSLCITLSPLPTIILLVFRIIKLPCRNKSSLVLLLCNILVSLITLLCVINYMTIDYQTINRCIAHEEYEKAFEYIEHKYGSKSTSLIPYELNAKVYVAETNYDEAANCYLDYCDQKENVLSINPAVFNMLEQYEDKVSAETRERIKALKNKKKEAEAAALERQKNDQETNDN